MVKLIQIDRLAPRIEAMLYKRTFDETWTLLSDSATKLIEAGEGLLSASHFKELLSVCKSTLRLSISLTVEPAYPAHWELHERHWYQRWGFRVPCQQHQQGQSFQTTYRRPLTLLQLVDTKSLNNTTLLHFVEKTVQNHFPEMAVFLDELEKPAEAYRGKHLSIVSL